MGRTDAALGAQMIHIWVLNVIIGIELAPIQIGGGQTAGFDDHITWPTAGK
jgi:hypothetical protein